MTKTTYMLLHKDSNTDARMTIIQKYSHQCCLVLPEPFFNLLAGEVHSQVSLQLLHRFRVQLSRLGLGRAHAWVMSLVKVLLKVVNDNAAYLPYNSFLLFLATLLMSSILVCVGGRCLKWYWHMYILPVLFAIYPKNGVAIYSEKWRC